MNGHSCATNVLLHFQSAAACFDWGANSGLGLDGVGLQIERVLRRNLFDTQMVGDAGDADRSGCTF